MRRIDLQTAFQTVEHVGKPRKVLLRPVGRDVDVLGLVALSVTLERRAADDHDRTSPRAIREAASHARDLSGLPGQPFISASAPLGRLAGSIPRAQAACGELQRRIEG